MDDLRMARPAGLTRSPTPILHMLVEELFGSMRIAARRLPNRHVYFNKLTLMRRATRFGATTVRTR